MIIVYAFMEILMCALDTNRNKKKLVKTLYEREPITGKKISVYINRQGTLINKKSYLIDTII